MRGDELSLDRFDPFDAAFLADPYSRYHRFRAVEPVHQGVAPFPSVARCTYAFRYDDVVAILSDPRLLRIRPGARDRVPGEPRWIRGLGRKMVLFNDPPAHHRLRTLLATAFSPDFIQSRSPHVTATTRRLVEELEPGVEVDLMGGLLAPLPVLVIAAVLGLPEEDAPLIRAWSDDLIAITDPRRGADGVRRAGAAAGEVLAYLRTVVRDRERAPGDDLISRMFLARRNGDRLSADEVIANAMLMLTAGHETTVGLLGNGVLALLRTPVERDRLAGDPGLLPHAVEELLRYDSPIQMTFRFAAEPLTIGGHAIEAGSAVAAVIGAANRDPEVFMDPDRLDLRRPSVRHLAFGLGTHFCMGPLLARMEAATACATLCERFPGMELAGEPEWRPTISFRALRRLPVAIPRRS